MAKAKIGNRDGGAGLSRGHASKRESDYAELFTALRAELDDLRTKYEAYLQNLMLILLPRMQLFSTVNLMLIMLQLEHWQQQLLKVKN